MFFDSAGRISGGRIRPVSCGETDSRRVTELFINHREQLLRRLLEE